MYNELTCIYRALCCPDCTPSIIRSIVRKQPDLLNSFNPKGFSPLYVALSNLCSFELIYELLQLGANANSRNHNLSYQTPLHGAIYFYNRRDTLPDLVQLLIKFGANINLRAKGNYTPLHTLLYHVKGEILIEVLDIFLKNGIHTDHITGNFISYLEYAMLHVRKLSSRLEVLKKLLEFGVKPDKDIRVNKYNMRYKNELNQFHIQFVKMLMQYVLVNEIKNDVSEVEKLMFSEQYDKIINLEAYREKKCYKELAEYRNALIKELLTMLLDKIDSNTTLFSFISEQCSSGFKNNFEESVLYKVISIFHSNRYACCYDLFQASIKQKALMSVLLNVFIFTNKSLQNSSSKAKVILNGDAVLKLASYLNRQDVLNLTLAYWTTDGQNEEYPAIGITRKRTSSRNMSLTDSSNMLMKSKRLKRKK